MSEHDLELARLGQILGQIARPYRCGESLPVDVQANLWQLGVPCDELTSREELIARLWARKRSLRLAVHSGWGPGPGTTSPPTAA